MKVEEKVLEMALGKVLGKLWRMPEGMASRYPCHLLEIAALIQPGGIDEVRKTK